MADVVDFDKLVKRAFGLMVDHMLESEKYEARWWQGRKEALEDNRDAIYWATSTHAKDIWDLMEYHQARAGMYASVYGVARDSQTVDPAYYAELYERCQGVFTQRHK